MTLFKKKKKRRFIDQVTQRSSIVPVQDKKQGLDFLVSFFSDIRPSSEKGYGNASKNLELAISAMVEHPVLMLNLKHALLSQLVNTDLSQAFTESGIPLARGFWQEFFGRLRHKLLPPLQQENDFLFVVNRVFFRPNDYQWVEGIRDETWVRFFETVARTIEVDDNSILIQLLRSVKILAFQVAQLGLEKEVVQYLPVADQELNPFVNQTYLIHQFEKLIADGVVDELPLASISGEIEQVIDHCYRSIGYIRERHPQLGTSLHQTYMLMILENKLNKMAMLIDLLDQDQHFDTVRLVNFFRMMVRNENRKNSIREFLSQCLGYLAYQIAEHKGSKGNAYITASRAQYQQMLYSAMKGGAIICFVAVIKNLLNNMTLPIFWHGFAASANYSAGFVLIDETHATLATKQPAFTASALASSLDTRKSTNPPNLYNLAITVAKVSRSQIASFIGNLVVVFPGTFLLAWLYDRITGSKIVAGEAATTLLRSQHPWQSLSLLYACNTGFFLFASGIIAGYVQNKIHYGQIARRLDTHPLLRLSLPTDRLHHLALYIEKHAGSIIGNVSLGFMLGMAGVIPHIFGIPFDIRHITISAANVSIAVYGLGWSQVNPIYLLVVILGVIGIGMLNFLVSFSLAFIVAVKSRGVHLKNYPEFLSILGRYFYRKPLDFIRPPKHQQDAV
jgi:site-specific recombinase